MSQNHSKQKLSINSTEIDWESEQSHYFFNPLHPQAVQLQKKAQEVPFLTAHLYLYSSSASKICLLSKKAFLSSAQKANQNLQAVSQDRWLISLPFYHVSGLSILARAFLSKSTYFIQESAWSPELFHQTIKKNKITLSALIPTQVYDLIKKNLKSPPSLRALLVGGDFLSPSLYQKARNLNWPILPCYGTTETSSHIAAADLNSLKSKDFPEMKLLKGIEIKALQKKQPCLFKIKTDSLLSAYFDLKNHKFYDPKDKEGFFLLENQLSFKKPCLNVHKTNSPVLKILGEKVDLNSLKILLKKHLEKEAHLQAFLLALPEKRRTWNLVLVGEAKDFKKLFYLMKNFNQEVLAYERLQALYFLAEAPRHQFLKIKKELLSKQLGF